MSSYTLQVDKKNKEISIEVFKEFTEFKIEKYENYFQINFKINNNESWGFNLFYNIFGGKKYYPTDIIDININNNLIKIKYGIRQFRSELL